MEFKDRLVELRKQNDVSQKDLAHVLGVKTGTIGNYEVGSRFPRANELIKIADYFGVSIDYLLCRTNNPVIPKVEIAIKGLPKELQEKLLDKKSGLPYLKLAAEFLDADIPEKELREYVGLLARVRKQKD